MRKLRRISVALMLSLAMLLNSQNALLSFATTQENSTSTQQIVLEEEEEPAQSDSEDGQTDGEQTDGEQSDGEQTEDEQTEVTCNFCTRKYVFTRDEILGLMK